MEFNRSLCPENPRLTGFLSKVIHLAHSRGSTLTICRLPLAPNTERNDRSGGGSVTRQRASVGDSLNDEQWGNCLSRTRCHIS